MISGIEDIGDEIIQVTEEISNQWVSVFSELREALDMKTFSILVLAFNGEWLLFFVKPTKNLFIIDRICLLF